MIGSVVARRYARALIDLGVETNTLDALVRDITAIAELVDQNAELRDVRDNPQVPIGARKAVFAEVTQRLGAGQMAKNTIMLLADNGRLRVLPAIARALREEADRRAGIVRAQVTSATPLSDAYVARLQQVLEARFARKVVVQRTVDPTLIAGVVTRVGDTIIDGSVRARLNELKSELMPQ
ncbi:MAG: ATP synthase F1 subunit delta [Deltaproteobacteria bacterium]|nr:ATP synthase F1 subunit delta [Deltaproteobacteria bacterium]